MLVCYIKFKAVHCPTRLADAAAAAALVVAVPLYLAVLPHRP